MEVESMARAYWVFSPALFTALLLLPAFVAPFDRHETCDSGGLYPIPHLVCAEDCSTTTQNKCSRISVTTNNGHAGSSCNCPGAAGPLCCKVAYVASINDYEVEGMCTASSCSAPMCDIQTAYDNSKPPQPILKYGLCH